MMLFKGNGGDSDITNQQRELMDETKGVTTHILIQSFDRITKGEKRIFVNEKIKNKQSDPAINTHHDAVLPNERHIGENMEYMNKYLMFYSGHDTQDPVGYVLVTHMNEDNCSEGYKSLFHYGALYNSKIPKIFREVFIKPSINNEDEFTNLDGLGHEQVEFIKKVINDYKWQNREKKMLQKILQKKVRASLGYTFWWSKVVNESNELYFADDFFVNDVSLTGTPRYKRCRIMVANKARVRSKTTKISKKTSGHKFYSFPIKSVIEVEQWEKYTVRMSQLQEAPIVEEGGQISIQNNGSGTSQKTSPNMSKTGQQNNSITPTTIPTTQVNANPQIVENRNPKPNRDVNMVPSEGTALHVLNLKYGIDIKHALETCPKNSEVFRNAFVAIGRGIVKEYDMKSRKLRVKRGPQIDMIIKNYKLANKKDMPDDMKSTVKTYAYLENGQEFFENYVVPLSKFYEEGINNKRARVGDVVSNAKKAKVDTTKVGKMNKQPNDGGGVDEMDVDPQKVANGSMIFINNSSAPPAKINVDLPSPNLYMINEMLEARRMMVKQKGYN